MEILNENFRKRLNLIETAFVNIQHINFDKHPAAIQLGLEWLCEVMKPITA
jgi:hypothetical protein